MNRISASVWFEVDEHQLKRSILRIVSRIDKNVPVEKPKTNGDTTLLAVIQQRNTSGYVFGYTNRLDYEAKPLVCVDVGYQADYETFFCYRKHSHILCHGLYIVPFHFALHCWNIHRKKFPHEVQRGYASRQPLTTKKSFSPQV